MKNLTIKQKAVLYGTLIVMTTVIVITIIQYLKNKNPYDVKNPSKGWELFNEIKGKAHSGDAESQLYYGVLFANGDGVEQDYREAAKWYQKAAEQGNARAQRNLALLYDCGVGVERDYAVALEWYLKAAKQNDAAAHIGISGYPFVWRYSIFPSWWAGPGAWISKACYLAWGDYLRDKNGDVYDSYYASIMDDEPSIAISSFGFGVRSKKWAYKDGLLPDFWSVYHANQLYHQSDALLVREVRKMASSGDTEAQLRMAVFYFHKQGVMDALDKNEKMVDRWLSEAASDGNHRAAFITAVPYPWTGKTFLRWPDLSEILVEDDLKRAEVIKNAAEHGDDDYFKAYYLKVLPTILTRHPEFAAGISDKDREQEYFTLYSKGVSEAGDEIICQENFFQRFNIFSDAVVRDARNGSSNADYLLYRKTISDAKNESEALIARIYLNKLLASANVEILSGISESFFREINGKIDLVNFYQEEAVKGDGVAAAVLGIMYFNDEDFKTSLRYFIQAAKLNIPISYYYLALFSEYFDANHEIDQLVHSYIFRHPQLKTLGKLLPSDLKITFYLISADLGYVPAICRAIHSIYWYKDDAFKNRRTNRVLIDEELKRALAFLVNEYFMNDEWYLYRNMDESANDVAITILRRGI